MSGGLHIGVDATCWPLARGFGRHTRCLLTALLQVDRHNRYTFFTDSPEAAAAIPAAADVRLVRTTHRADDRGRVCPWASEDL